MFNKFGQRITNPDTQISYTKPKEDIPLPDMSGIVCHAHTLEEAIDSNKLITFLPGERGVYKVVNNAMGKFIGKVNDVDDVIGGVPVTKGLLEFKLPKIPYVLYQQIVKFFIDVYAKSSTEAMVCIYWDTESKSYYAEPPTQILSGVTVNYEKPQKPPTHILVCDIHSHNIMGAFWSGTDNKDEQSTQFYGVVGRITTTIDCLFRVSVSGDQYDIDQSEIFDDEIVALESVVYPEDWGSYIVERPVVTYKPGNYCAPNRSTRSRLGTQYSYPRGSWMDDEEYSLYGYGYPYEHENQHTKDYGYELDEWQASFIYHSMISDPDAYYQIFRHFINNLECVLSPDTAQGKLEDTFVSGWSDKTKLDSYSTLLGTMLDSLALCIFIGGFTDFLTDTLVSKCEVDTRNALILELLSSIPEDVGNVLAANPDLAQEIFTAHQQATLTK